MMTFLSLLPQGLWQTYQSIAHSYVSARSVEFIQSDVMHALVWAHQKPTFHPLGDFLNPALALLGQALNKSPIGQNLSFC
jgi:hypothetical protein